MTPLLSAFVNDQAVALSNRGKILALEAQILAHPEAKSAKDYPLQHHFAPGQYGREIFMPAGDVVTGRIHRHAHVNVLSAGVCEVFTEEGGLELLEAPLTWVSAPGTKRTVRVIKDALWTTFHCNPTNERDPNKLVEMLTYPDFAARDEELAP